MSVAPRPSARLPINAPVGQQRAAFASRPRSHSPSSSPPQPTDEDEEEEEAMAMSDGEGVPPHEQDEPSPSPAAAASASSSSLVRLVSSDGSLPAAARARLLPAARLLEAAIHSDILAHILALYHYVHLQRAMTLELHVGVKAAAHRLNGWLSAAYAAAEDGGDGHASGQPECVRRIKHDACRVYTILNDADDSDSSDEAAAAAPWWPQLLQSLCAGGRRPTHALAVLRALNRHHGAICASYPSVAVRHQLYSYYLRTKCWSARQVEEDLQADGVIDAEADAEEPKQEDEDAEAKQEEQEAEAEAESPVPHSKRARVSRAPVRRRDAGEHLHPSLLRGCSSLCTLTHHRSHLLLSVTLCTVAALDSKSGRRCKGTRGEPRGSCCACRRCCCRRRRRSTCQSSTRRRRSGSAAAADLGCHA